MGGIDAMIIPCGSSDHYFSPVGLISIAAANLTCWVGEPLRHNDGN